MLILFMSLSKYLISMCKKYTDGFDFKTYQLSKSSKAKIFGKSIKANKHIKFLEFAEWLDSMGCRHQSIRKYISDIHHWDLPVNETALSNFKVNVVKLDRNRRDYACYNRKHWKPKFESKNQDAKARCFNRFQYNVLLVLRKYLEFMEKREWIDLLPSKVNRPSKNVKHGIMSIDEFAQFIGCVKDDQFNLFFRVIKTTGGRVSEILCMRKQKRWIPRYNPHEKMDIQTDKLFKITIPETYAKTEHQQRIYIDEPDVIRDFIKWVNAKKDGVYIFNFIGHKGDKNYIEIQREMHLIRKETKRAIIEAKLPDDKINEMTCHAWRRSLIHHTQEKFGNLAITQERARHSSATITSDYLDIETKNFEKVLQEGMLTKDANIDIGK